MCQCVNYLNKPTTEILAHENREVPVDDSAVAGEGNSLVVVVTLVQSSVVVAVAVVVRRRSSSAVARR